MASLRSNVRGGEKSIDIAEREGRMTYYKGPNRRVHTIFMTKNTEYHICSMLCVAVRHRQTGIWISNHEAVGMMLERPKDKLYLGRSLTLISDSSKIRTSKVVDILRPGRTTVAMYDLLWAVCPSVFEPAPRTEYAT
jgi:hypothetical protein